MLLAGPLLVCQLQGRVLPPPLLAPGVSARIQGSPSFGDGSLPFSALPRHSRHISVPVCLCPNFLFTRTLVILNQGLPKDLILACLNLQRLYFQIRSYSEVRSVKTSVSLEGLVGNHNPTHNGEHTEVQPSQSVLLSTKPGRKGFCALKDWETLCSLLASLVVNLRGHQYIYILKRAARRSLLLLASETYSSIGVLGCLCCVNSILVKHTSRNS